MNKSINIGNGAFIPADNIDFYVSPGSAPFRRAVTEAEEAKTLADTTCGKRTRALIFLKTGMIVKSILSTEAIASRLNKEPKASE